LATRSTSRNGLHTKTSYAQSDYQGA